MGPKFAYWGYMHAHTKVTFYFLMFLGVGVLVWWWLPMGSSPVESANQAGEAQPASDATTVTDPVPPEPASEAASEPPPVTANPDETNAATVSALRIIESNASVVQAEITIVWPENELETTDCATASFGEIAWGDGTSEPVYGAGCGAGEHTLDISHQYDTSGEYTVTFTDQQQEPFTQTVTVREGVESTD